MFLFGLSLASVTSWWSAVWQTYVLVSIAELFDKTFFVVLLLALRHNKRVVWLGGTLALFLHTFLAAIGGYAIQYYFRQAYVDLAAAALYGVFGVIYFHEMYNTPADADIRERTEEAEGDLKWMFGGGGDETEALVNKKDTVPSQGPASPGLAAVFWVAFATTFIAEMGDRTQIAMISQHAVQPLFAVVLGSCVAFAQLNTVAVLVGGLVQRQGLKERTVLMVASVAFVFFAALTFRQAMRELTSASPSAGVVRGTPVPA